MADMLCTTCSMKCAVKYSMQFAYGRPTLHHKELMKSHKEYGIVFTSHLFM